MEHYRSNWRRRLASLASVCLGTFTGLTVQAATPSGIAKDAPAVTFYRDIAPIVYLNCSPCHRPGESAPFSLLTYEDAKRHAAQIAEVTRKRVMPPWLPEKGFGTFVEERRLTDEQIARIRTWVQQGTPAGSPSDGPAKPSYPGGWRLGKPDLVLHVPKPYTLAAGGGEVFWNFIVPVPINKTRWVKAVEILPGNPKVIHHASLILDRAQSARRQSKSAEQGFSGMDFTIEEAAFDPDGTFLAWKPGSVPAAEPDGMAWRAEPGMDLIFNVHLRPSGKPEVVDPQIGLHFTDAPQTKFPMLLELENDARIDIPAGDRDYVVKDDFRLPMDVQILAVYPHAHYLGKLLEGYATLPDGSRKWLIKIPEWDLNWQGVYHLKSPLTLPRGSVISMRFHYDNSAANPRNPNRPPARVKGGGQANDEMGNLWLQVLPVAAGDQRMVLEEAVMRQRLEKYPDDFSSNFNLGDVLLGRGDAAAALPYFEAACRVRPNSALAFTEYGAALSAAGKLNESIAALRHALELEASFTDARFNLASVEAQSGDLQTAASDFRLVLAARPGDAKATQHLGEVLFMLGDRLANYGDLEKSAASYQEALTLRSSDAELHTAYGMVLARLGRMQDARSELRTALQLNPSFVPAKNALAAVEQRLLQQGAR